jgi:excisionase family DNA binding protein
MDDVFLTTTEVLEYLQVNLRTVYRLLKAGKLPAVRVGRQWRFRKADVDAWLERQRPSGRPAPAATPAPGPAPAVRRTVAAATPAITRVLVADDEESIRELLSRTLALADYEVRTVADGQAAIDCLRAEPFQLLITDLSMPKVDGLGVVREARRLHPRLPVVIITGYSTEAAAIEAINLGVSGYLTKPFRIAKILAVAAHALGDEE